MDHWGRLRAAIDARGLTALIAEGGERAAANLVSELTDGPSIDNFDPLMAAHNAIMSNALATAGLEVMYANEDGSDRCPLCWMNEQANNAGNPTPNAYDDWIDRAADDALAVWQEMRP